MTCPTCGHAHPNGIGLNLCMCDDCALLWHDKPGLLAPAYAMRRIELLKKLEKERLENEATRASGN